MPEAKTKLIADICGLFIFIHLASQKKKKKESGYNPSANSEKCKMSNMSHEETQAHGSNLFHKCKY